ncbi:MAG: GNAT superfamily N-acetyltransferase [Lysobacterales bacterium]|jgi:GNAT superfamily N-acetyltransferase
MPAPQLQIRPAQKSDAALILAFINELADYEKLAHEVVAKIPQLEETLFGDRPYANVVIAEWDGQPTGFALFFSNYSTFLSLPGIYLEDLFVRPEFRGKGIGKSLLIHLASLVIQRGWGRLDWSVLDWNDPAIDFYKNIGARPLGEWLQFRLDGTALKNLTQV